MMKKVMILFLLLFVVKSQAQVIELGEAKVTYPSPTMEALTNPNGYTMVIKEQFDGQFIKDPLKFMKNNFDIKLLLDQEKKDGIGIYQVNFKCRKGFLSARFDDEGELIGTFQKFQNIPLPNALAHDIYRDYKGWEMIENLYVARGKADKIDKEIYKIKLMNGNKIQKIKIKPYRSTNGKVASN